MPCNEERESTWRTRAFGGLTEQRAALVRMVRTKFDHRFRYVALGRRSNRRPHQDRRFKLELMNLHGRPPSTTCTRSLRLARMVRADPRDLGDTRRTGALRFGGPPTFHVLRLQVDPLGRRQH